ncbi:MAG: protein-ADP-ribose hydrolase [Bacteroidales bacterium]|nr:protein-ADP-ribose hydrolase [Bacteroidales bacterium]
MNLYDNIGWICRYLLDENPRYRKMVIPENLEERQALMRSLLNIRMPLPVTQEFLQAQDAELQAQLADKGVVEINRQGLVEWQGDITSLKVDAIVNAANSRMLGCFVPMHRCIDNAIHSAAGVQLRLACQEMMQGGEEPTGSARITPGFNLPAKYVLHTVGPIVTTARPLRQQEVQLASCYRSCLELADKNGLRSIAFCCISTGEFRFPNDLACEIAVQTVRDYLASNPKTNLKTIVFNTFKDIDHELYSNALAEG